MNDNEKDLQNTKELFDFLQGEVPEGTIIDPSHVPHLTPDQAWTVIWYLGNKYWQVTDHVERCDVCGELYNSWCEGDHVDGPNPPYSFCGNCNDSPLAHSQRRIERNIEHRKIKARRVANKKDQT